MQKIIIITILFTGLLFASMDITQAANSVMNKIFSIDKINHSGQCQYYRAESYKYFRKGNQSPNVTVAWRYLNIANRYADQYGECVSANNSQQFYQGYKPNPYQQIR